MSMAPVSAIFSLFFRPPKIFQYDPQPFFSKILWNLEWNWYRIKETSSI
jgi:hypothetical protein